MTDHIIDEQETFDKEVYRIENTDEVMGGQDGPANKGIVNLANRTQWLRKQIEDLSVSSGFGVVPIGGIIMWHGNPASYSSIPKNWKLCNGENGTPNLIDKFVIGAGQYDETETFLVTNVEGVFTKSGGSADAVVVEHSHSLSDGGVRKTTGPYDYSGGPGYSQGDVLSETAQTGESGVNKNLPPYYALAYIMRVS